MIYKPSQQSCEETDISQILTPAAAILVDIYLNFNSPSKSWE